MGEIIRFRRPWRKGAGQQRYRRRGSPFGRRPNNLFFGLGILVAAAIGHLLSHGSPQDVRQLAANVPASPAMVLHVIDGDTIDYGGQRIRMIDYDAPEIGEPKCAYELDLGRKATQRLREILSSGAIEIAPQGDRDVDRYGRKLRLVTVNGRSVGDLLIAEGLAHPWEGHRHFWCG